jgi:hypothetical protein
MKTKNRTLRISDEDWLRIQAAAHDRRQTVTGYLLAAADEKIQRDFYDGKAPAAPGVDTLTSWSQWIDKADRP